MCLATNFPRPSDGTQALRRRPPRNSCKDQRKKIVTPDPTVADGVDRRIRAAAAHRGLTLAALAKALKERHPHVKGVAHANLKALGFSRDARPDQLAAIADVTGMPLWYLVAGIDGLDHIHQPEALVTVPSETLAEVQELRKMVEILIERTS